MCSGLMHHGMEEMHPLIGVRVGHPQELSWHLLDGMLCQVGHNEEQVVRHRGSETRVLRPVTAARAGLPSNGAVPQIGHQRGLERGQPRRECLLGEPRHRPYTPSPLGTLLVAWQRHLRHAVMSREA
jgi:hypothetical protein